MLLLAGILVLLLFILVNSLASHLLLLAVLWRSRMGFMQLPFCHLQVMLSAVQHLQILSGLVGQVIRFIFAVFLLIL